MPAVLLPNGKQQFFTTPGVPAVGYKLATFAAGTSSNQTTWADALKVGANTNPIILDARGEAVIFWDGTYKVQLQDATGAVIWTVDNVTSSPAPSASMIPTVDNSFTLGSPSFSWANLYLGPGHATAYDSVSGNIAYFKQTLAEIAAGVTPTAYGYVPGDARRYGADPLGVAPADAAWASNVAQASQAGGAEMFASGTFLLNTGIVMNTDGMRLRGAGMGIAIFKAGANGINVIKVCQSRCHLSDFTIDANGHTTVDGLVLAPANEATNALNNNNFNNFDSIEIKNGVNNGIRLRTGPTIATVDSGTFYNTFKGVWLINCIRGIWFQDTILNGASEPNRNTFMGVRAGGTALNLCNTGMQIDVGGTNKFFGVDFEGILNGTAPNAVPTAVKIASLGANGVSCDDNHFFGCFMEANTRDLDNRNSSVDIFGGFWSAAKFAVGVTISSITNAVLVATATTATAHGLTTGQRVRMLGQTPAAYGGRFVVTVTSPTTFTYNMLSNPGGAATVQGTFDVPPREFRGMDPSLSPTLSPGMEYGEAIPGFASSYWGMLKEIADLNLNWQAYALTTGIMTNVATIGASASQFRQLGNMVSWHASFTFNASVAGTQVTITPPAIPNLALYSTLLGNNAYYSFFVEDGTGIRKAVEAGWLSTGKLYIKAPAAWNTAGNNNVIFLAIEFHL